MVVVKRNHKNITCFMGKKKKPKAASASSVLSVPAPVLSVPATSSRDRQLRDPDPAKRLAAHVNRGRVPTWVWSRIDPPFVNGSGSKVNQWKVVQVCSVHVQRTRGKIKQQSPAFSWMRSEHTWEGWVVNHRFFSEQTLYKRKLSRWMVKSETSPN